MVIIEKGDPVGRPGFYLLRFKWKAGRDSPTTSLRQLVTGSAALMMTLPAAPGPAWPCSSTTRVEATLKGWPAAAVMRASNVDIDQLRNRLVEYLDNELSGLVNGRGIINGRSLINGNGIVNGRGGINGLPFGEESPVEAARRRARRGGFLLQFML